MKRRAVDPHLPFRRLLAEQLDAPLQDDVAEGLRAHLSACAACRSVDGAYRAQRDALRALPSSEPPRDLWARTAAALDREVAATRASGAGSRRPAVGPRVIAGATLTVAIAVVGVGSQLRFVGGDGDGGPSGKILPTPFDVPARRIAVLDEDEGGLSLYQTQVSEVCPASEIDCLTVAPARRRLLRVPGALAPTSVSIHPSGERAVIAARLHESEAVYVVQLPPVDNPPRAVDVPDPTDDRRLATPSATLAFSPAPSAGATGQDPVRPRETTGADRPSASVTASVAPDASDAPETPSFSPTRSFAPRSPAATTAASASAAPTVPRSPAATASIGAAASPSLAPPSATARTTASPSAGSSAATAQPAVATTAAATATPNETASPPGASSPPLADGRAILEGVVSVGASPAWSPGGDLLAFSAMPADRSTGPDVYIWRVGDDRARPVTHDHRSYFASWAGSRIVASRVTSGAEMSGAPHVSSRSVVIDPTSGEERAIPLRGLWLPSVDPIERYAIAWRGELQRSAGTVVPVAGALYLVDWRALDPFAPTDGRSTPATAAPTEAPASPTNRSPAPPADASPGTPTPVARAAEPTSTGDATAPATVGRDGDARGADASASASHATASPSDAGASPAPGHVRPLEPGRDESRDPVVEWRVRWAEDGSAYGFWVADAPGSSWGRLSVVSLDAADALGDADVAYLGPTLARRAFTVRSDRVVWVAPTEDDPDGELRVRTWGTNGYGGVRMPDIDVGEVLLDD